MSAGVATRSVKTIAGSEMPKYEVPVNKFIADHPSVPDSVADETRTHTGELERTRWHDIEAARQLALLGENCNDVLLHAPEDDEKHGDVKRKAFDSIIETIVYLQNPKYATDQVEVYGEAIRIHNEHEARKSVHAAFNEVPSDYDYSHDLLETWEAHVARHYNLKRMRRRAAKTLAPMIAPSVADQFTDMTGVKVEARPIVDRFERALGSVAAFLTVGPSGAKTV